LLAELLLCLVSCLISGEESRCENGRRRTPGLGIHYKCWIWEEPYFLELGLSLRHVGGRILCFKTESIRDFEVEAFRCALKSDHVVIGDNNRNKAMVKKSKHETVRHLWAKLPGHRHRFHVQGRSF
jgi:hypothetical protein